MTEKPPTSADFIAAVRSAIATSHAIRRERATKRRRAIPDGGIEGFEHYMSDLDNKRQREIRAITSIEQHTLRDYSRPAITRP